MVDFDVKRMLVDGGSATNVLIWEAFFGAKNLSRIIEIRDCPLQGIEWAILIPKKTIELSGMLGTYPASMVILMRFYLSNTHGIQCNLWLTAVEYRWCYYFNLPSSHEILGQLRVGWVKGDQQASLRCHVESIQAKGFPLVMMSDFEPTRS